MIDHNTRLPVFIGPSLWTAQGNVDRDIGRRVEPVQLRAHRLGYRVAPVGPADGPQLQPPMVGFAA